MIGIYLDNYRGFSDQYIELKKVNFLVGENSTGKTSFLSIIKLMSTPSFWFSADLNDSNFRLGSFSELISAGSKNKKSFSIGFYTNESDDRPKKNIKPEFKMVTFINEEGLPVVSKHSFIVNDTLVTTIIRKGALLYKQHKLDFESITPKEIFNFTFSEHQISSVKGYKKITAPGFSRNLFFYHADTLVLSALEGKNFFENRKSFGFSLEASLPRLCWVAPIRAKPESTYEGYKTNNTADGEHIPQLLNKIITKSKNKNKSSPLVDALAKFGQASGLFQKLDTKSFGRDLASPFEMHVVINNKTLKICNVGYGVSQVLPIVTEVLARSDSPVFSIQQPEVHLHPRAQAALGEFIYQAASLKGTRFLIETHSDYLIDRFRLCEHKSVESNTNSQVLFFERGESENKVHTLSIDEDGAYPQEQPEMFREFFINEELELLRL